ncbi:uncharacterized protein LOC142599727 isoform X1 [Balearica regulorum gibbericeps]|uniref:uncharacterized protein LOC142599727 isoform X1 n=2 Tax=Balearica regulorum gibbericeps TaxID=100784 RepID=UPI003F5F44A1
MGSTGTAGMSGSPWGDNGVYGDAWVLICGWGSPICTPHSRALPPLPARGGSLSQENEGGGSEKGVPALAPHTWGSPSPPPLACLPSRSTMEPQLGPYPPLYPPAGPFPAVGQPHWEPRPPEAPPGPWAPLRGDDPPGHLDPFSQAFASRLPGKAWGAGTPVAGGVTPPQGYLPYSGAPPEEPPPTCLYQDLQPPPCAPPAPFQGPALQGLGGAEGFAGLLGPPDWVPDGARCYQDPNRYFRGAELPFPGVPPWPEGSLGEVGGSCELSPPWAGGTAPPEAPLDPPGGGRASPYRSRLGLGGGPPRYRPPPMLDPGRGGPGLFGGLLAGVSPPGAADPLRLLSPQINVGPSFQAAVPPATGGGCEQDPPGGAALAWSPWPGLEGDPETQQQVETLLDLACSSALPGGGTNRELALHCLARAGGSLTGALELLLLGTPAWPWADPLAGYHYTGSDAWTPRERRLFAKALARHGKDFTRIQQAVPSKRMTQCVEFYYLYKSRLGQTQKQTPPEALVSRFPCKLCGKIFPKIKSRNAHMKIHRQQEGWGGPPLLPPPWPPGPPTIMGGMQQPLA